MARQRLQEAAERAKIELSSAQETSINLPYITAGAEGPLHLDEKLTRAEFQRMTQDLLDRCRAPFNAVIKDANTSVDKIDHGHPRRRLDPHAGRRRPGQGADRRQGAQQGRQPRRGRRPRRGRSRPASSRARSRTCCCSTSPR
jgi:hypothetical protein